MVKYKFEVSMEGVGSSPTEIVEFPDDCTEEEVNDCFNEWVWNHIYTKITKID